MNGARDNEFGWSGAYGNKITETSIDILPNEILEKVFRLLPPSDLRSVVLVTSRWRDIGDVVSPGPPKGSSGPGPRSWPRSGNTWTIVALRTQMLGATSTWKGCYKAEDPSGEIPP
eukprot:GFUD01105864.1.p1 GENE.GFUD01105864.1~~GFUD01105864.1.p1  ORF type:complete len:116 (-),score=10.63 GFUD01105864.1:38-385(-)